MIEEKRRGFDCGDHIPMPVNRIIQHLKNLTYLFDTGPDRIKRIRQFQYAAMCCENETITESVRKHLER